MLGMHATAYVPWPEGIFFPWQWCQWKQGIELTLPSIFFGSNLITSRGEKSSCEAGSETEKEKISSYFLKLKMFCLHMDSVYI